MLPMSLNYFSPLNAMIAQIERQAVITPDAVRVISDDVKAAIQAKADPYVLSGALIEGIAMTLLANIPEQMRKSVASDALKLMYSRCPVVGMMEELNE